MQYKLNSIECNFWYKWNVLKFVNNHLSKILVKYCFRLSGYCCLFNFELATQSLLINKQLLLELRTFLNIKTRQVVLEYNTI